MIKKLILAFTFLLITNNVFAMELEETKNLISKTGIGMSIKEIDNFKELTFEKAVNKLLDEANTNLENNPPNWVNEAIYHDKKEFNAEQKKEYQKKRNSQIKELKTWWYKEMITTDSPITEHMTLFWHNHFTSGEKKVRHPKMMFEQNQIFRKNALGNFKTLLHEISKNPAMLIYLDTNQNRKNKPNENFAREVLELFTLGEGNYSEKDIKEAARAFTGWKINNQTGEYFFNKKTFDNKEKTFLGKKGNFNGDDILDIILEQPQTSIYITKKFWKEFISINPDKKEVERIAEVFRKNNYEIKVLLKEILMSPFFNKKDNYGSMIKSPVELLAGTFRLLNIPIEENDKNIEQLVKYSARLGQDIFDPPNVKGWEGGKLWINSDSFVNRKQALQRITRGMEIFSKEYQEKHLNLLPTKNTQNIFFEMNSSNILENYLFSTKPINKISKELDTPNFVRKAILDPVYQLK